MSDLLSPDEINALLSGGGGLFNEDEISPEDKEQLDKVINIFTTAQKSVINMLAGKDIEATAGEPEIIVQDDFRGKFDKVPFLFSNTFGGFEDKPLAIVIEQDGALTLADFMMGGDGSKVPDPSDLYFNAAQEGISQIVGSAFTSLSGLLGGRRLMPENTTSALAENHWVPFSLEPGDSKIWAVPADINISGTGRIFKIWTCLLFEDALELADLIRSGGKKNEPAPAPAPAQAPSGGNNMGGGRPQTAPVDVRPAAFQPLGGGSSGGTPSPIDLIADIPVRVTVELGKARKSVSEILALTSGAVIELDKMAGEPVDILVNGKLIAHGEVVVIDENFGVRLTDIVATGAARVAS